MATFLDESKRTVILAAHPDDEVIGAATALPGFPELTLAHATDGAPVDMVDARRNGFATRRSYAQARRKELEDALQQAGATHAELVEFGFTDQQAGHRLVELTARLLDLLLLRKPDLLLTHPFEGGHPDHDACAFASRAAVRLSGLPVRIGEFTSYHAGPSGLTPGQFLDHSRNCVKRQLTEAERVRRRDAYSCFTTQAQVLEYFPIVEECFRIAPRYDFTRPPHSGRLFYENFDWGMTSDAFCARAREALAELRLEADS
jgi:N-acetylglucosamine malate deacetylase 2